MFGNSAGMQMPTKPLYFYYMLWCPSCNPASSIKSWKEMY